MTPRSEPVPLHHLDVTDGGSEKVALLDRDGVIVHVNEAWLRFARENGGDPAHAGVGGSYLTAWESVVGDSGAAQVAEAIRAATRGDLSPPMTVTIARDGAVQPRLLDVLVSSRLGTDGACIGATVCLTPTSAGEPAPGGEGDEHLHRLPDLTFPDTPRLLLEEALVALTGHAQNVLNAQGRLRALIRANSMVASDLSEEVVLHRLVSAAQDLIGARHGLLVVFGPDGAVDRLVHVETDEEAARRLGELATGRGFLDAPLRYPVSRHETSPPDHPAGAGSRVHPAVSSVLAVAICMRNQPFGNLYLTESTHGAFTDEDEQLATAFASSAGTAIDNARLYHETEQHKKWLAASNRVTQELFAGVTDQSLDLVLRLAAQGADADLANFVLPSGKDPADGWTVHAATGLLADTVVGLAISETSAVRQVIESGQPLLIDDYATHTGDLGIYGLPRPGVVVGSLVCAPLVAEEQVVGVLSVGRVAGHGLFTKTDMEQLTQFAGHAGLALRLAQARQVRDALERMEDQDRIAADLHSKVIQDLFATGIGLQGMVRLLPSDGHQQRLLGYVDAIDGTIRRIRHTVTQLKGAGGPRPAPLRDRLLEVLQKQATALGFPPGLELAGPTECLTSEMADEVVAVVGEALGYVVRHAHATLAAVRVAVVGELVTIEVTDNGDGTGAEAPSRELTLLRRRAHARRGALELSRQPGGGTSLRWTGRI